MVNNCVCAGCNYSARTGHRVHGFPKDKATRRQWVHFVRVRRADFSFPSVTKNSKICSAHFTEEDYDQGDVRMVSLGLKRLAQLVPTAVPSVHTHLSACPAPRPRSTKIGGARRKRELATMLTDASLRETADSVSGATVEDPLPSSTCDTGSQCTLKPLGGSHDFEVNLKPKMVSMGTQTTFSTQTFPPLTSPDQTDGEDNHSVISDTSWVPGDQMSEEVLCEEPSLTCDPHQNGIDKFIVCQEELMARFAICPVCSEKSDSTIGQQEGAFVRMEQVGFCLHSRPYLIRKSEHLIETE
ncbi:uncharacterized protein LOC115543701 [Gadus morhua]|uniref:uncharacterized protein LOC115543701 n=1 Tax=Gadus morhua TaxID=8049 RepID=UPI0011B49A52|nr:uncharacterized protein LOC115543701 [Gadus morhua]